MADIDRIEVIRGPGAALWGANAVNGVINILTRSARDTQGSAARLGAGKVDRVYAAARSGFELGEAAMRVYAQGTAIDPSRPPGGGEAIDGLYREQAGFRLDLPLPELQSLTVSADAYSGHERSARIDRDGDGESDGVADTDVSGADLVARWSGRTAGGSDWALQAYYDGYHRDIPDVYEERRNTFDIDFQQGFRVGSRHALLYGANYRASRDKTAGPPDAIIFSPARRTLRSGGAFVQDQITLSPTVELTLGSKFESSSSADFEIEPSVRIGWRAGEELYTWAAVSRAVRTPNRLDEDVAIFCPPPDGFPGICGPGLFRIGNPKLDSTKLIAYEWGLRLWSQSQFSLDLATFYKDRKSVV
jgi:iron complex outermembrane receptor protein